MNSNLGRSCFEAYHYGVTKLIIYVLDSPCGQSLFVFQAQELEGPMQQRICF